MTVDSHARKAAKDISNAKLVKIQKAVSLLISVSLRKRKRSAVAETIKIPLGVAEAASKLVIQSMGTDFQSCLKC